MPDAICTVKKACHEAAKVLPSFAIGAYAKAIANAWRTHTTDTLESIASAL